MLQDIEVPLTIGTVLYSIGLLGWLFFKWADKREIKIIDNVKVKSNVKDESK